MNIAYYEENNYHTEIMGTFLYYFREKGIMVTVYNNMDRSEYVQYFKKICNFELKKIDEFKKFHHTHNYIILGTSYSIEHIRDMYNHIKYKIIPVCHLKENINDNEKCIILSPINLINKNCNYIFPIHNFMNNCTEKKANIFSLIGRFKDDNRDTQDLINTITKYHDLNYEIHIYSRHKKFIPKKIFELQSAYPNRLKIFLKIKMDMLEKRINNSKFLITLVKNNSCYHNDRLSGILPLAFNYNIPLIMDKSLNNIYKFESSIQYNNSLAEVIEYVTNINGIEYTNLVNKVALEKKNIIENNNNTLGILLK